jgi:putative endonuclease
MADSKHPWTVYVLRCRDHSLYCGITTNLEKRLGMHRRGKASHYTRARLPVEVVFCWQAETHSAALREEAAFKRLSRKQKMTRISPGTSAEHPASGLRGFERKTRRKNTLLRTGAV